MKKSLLIILFSAGFISLTAQDIYPISTPEKKSSISLGIFHGGGSLVGADLEFLVSDRVGLQIGAGYIGFGAALNYHVKPTIRSSYFSLMYWNQGVGKTFSQNLIGPSFVFRGKRWFTAQIGLGFPLSKGPGWTAEFEQPPVMLTYAIGFYVPL